MRIVIALTCLLACAPAAAQVASSAVLSAPVGQGSAPFTAATGQFRGDERRDPNAELADIARRAGAWGQCVVAAASPDSRAYLTTQRTTALLRWSFERCQRKVGLLNSASVDSVRRAALLDALRTAS